LSTQNKQAFPQKQNNSGIKIRIIENDSAIVEKIAAEEITHEFALRLK